MQQPPAVLSLVAVAFEPVNRWERQSDKITHSLPHRSNPDAHLMHARLLVGCRCRSAGLAGCHVLCHLQWQLLPASEQQVLGLPPFFVMSRRRKQVVEYRIAKETSAQNDLQKCWQSAGSPIGKAHRTTPRTACTTTTASSTASSSEPTPLSSTVMRLPNKGAKKRSPHGMACRAPASVLTSWPAAASTCWLPWCPSCLDASLLVPLGWVWQEWLVPQLAAVGCSSPSSCSRHKARSNQRSSHAVSHAAMASSGQHAFHVCMHGSLRNVIATSVLNCRNTTCRC